MVQPADTSARRAKQPLAGVSASDAVFQCRVRDADQVRNVCHWKLLAFVLKIKCPSLVPCLLRSRRPTTVPGRVVSVNVDAIKGVSGTRAWTHVGVEVCELLPAFADGNASPAVVLKILVGRFCAAFAHLRPNVVLGRISHAMRGIRCLQDLGDSAAARLDAPGSQAGAEDALFGAAVAANSPAKLGSILAFGVEHDEAAETPARHVDESVVRLLAAMIRVSHCRTSQQVGGGQRPDSVGALIGPRHFTTGN